MAKLEELKKRRSELDAKIQSLEQRADSDHEGQMPDEMLVEYKALTAEIDEVDAEINKIKEAEALRAKNAESRKAFNTRKTTPEKPGESAEKQVAEQEKPKLPARPKAAFKLKNFVGDVNGVTADIRAYRFGMWCLARLSNDIPGRFHFANAMQFARDHFAAVHQENDGTTGGLYLVPEEFGQDLIDLRERYGVARRLFKIRPMMSDTRTDPRRTGGLTAYFTAEGAAGTESNKTWDQVRLTAKDLMVISRYTAQLSADAVINIGDDLAGEISYAFSNKEDECAFNGTGTSTYGGIQGVRNRLDDVDGSGTDSSGLVAQGTSNTWSAIVLADFDNVVGKLPQYADTPNTAWVMHRTFYYSVCEKLVQAAGGVPAYEVREGNRRPRPLFKGYPVEFSQVFPSTTATATVVATLGDYSLGASFGDRQGTQISFSEHATIGGENVFERNEIAIRGVERFDINVHDVGSSSTPGPIVGLKTGS